MEPAVSLRTWTAGVETEPAPLSPPLRSHQSFSYSVCETPPSMLLLWRDLNSQKIGDGRLQETRVNTSTL